MKKTGKIVFAVVTVVYFILFSFAQRSRGSMAWPRS